MQHQEVFCPSNNNPRLPVLQSHMVERNLVEDLEQRLTAAEEALAIKQNKIDDMKQEMFQKEKELETISVFQAQVGPCVKNPHKKSELHGFTNHF